MINILYPDSTLGSLSLSQDIISIRELKSSLSKHYRKSPIAIIFEDDEQKVTLSDIRLLLTFQDDISYPDTSSVIIPERTNTIVYPIVVTPNSQTAAIWETTASSIRQEVTILCNEHGEKKRAIFIMTPQNDFTGNNALIPIEKGDYIVTTTLQKHLYTTNIYTILSWNKTEYTAKLLHVELLSDDPLISSISYERYYQICPKLKSPIRSSKRKVKKGKTWDIHYADYKHLLPK